MKKPKNPKESQWPPLEQLVLKMHENQKLMQETLKVLTKSVGIINDRLDQVDLLIGRIK